MITVNSLIELLENIRDEHGNITVHLTDPTRAHRVIELEPAALVQVGGDAHLVVANESGTRLDRTVSNLWEYEY